MLAFSTLWRFQNTQDYFAPFWEQHLDYFELLNSQTLALSWIGSSPLKIVDVALPTPKEEKKVPNLCSELENERQEAIQQLLHAAQKAKELRAPYVVVWAGTVSFLSVSNPHSADLNTLPTPEQLATRTAIAAPYLDRLCRALFIATKQFPELGFCILPAAHWTQIPFLEELELVQSDLKKCSIYYWHNTAHIHLLEKAGLLGHEAWLTKYGKCTIGVHLEDVRGIESQYPPGLGEIAFSKIKPYLPSKSIYVVRINSQFEWNDVCLCYQYLREQHWI